MGEIMNTPQAKRKAKAPIWILYYRFYNWVECLYFEAAAVRNDGSEGITHLLQHHPHQPTGKSRLHSPDSLPVAAREKITYSRTYCQTLVDTKLGCNNHPLTWKIGPIILHGPHHEAVKSTTTSLSPACASWFLKSSYRKWKKKKKKRSPVCLVVICSHAFATLRSQAFLFITLELHRFQVTVKGF